MLLVCVLSLGYTVVIPKLIDLAESQNLLTYLSKVIFIFKVEIIELFD